VRVLQVDSGREWRGGQNQVRLLCRELVRLGSVEQVLVTQRGSALAERAAADGVTVRGAGWTLGFDPRAVRQVFVAMRTLQPAVVHAHDSHSLMAALWARRFTARRGLTPPIIATRRVDFHVARSSTWFRAAPHWVWLITLYFFIGGENSQSCEINTMHVKVSMTIATCSGLWIG